MKTCNELNWANTTEWSGETFPVRDWLKKAGAKWDADRKVWTLDGGMLTRVERVQAIRLIAQYALTVIELN